MINPLTFLHNGWHNQRMLHHRGNSCVQTDYHLSIYDQRRNMKSSKSVIIGVGESRSTLSVPASSFLCVPNCISVFFGDFSETFVFVTLKAFLHTERPENWWNCTFLHEEQNNLLFAPFYPLKWYFSNLTKRPR